jgi:CheY-like chemotaxis protein
VLLTVSDTGPGIDEAAQDRLLEGFVTAEAAGQASDFGLATAHAVIERLSARMSIQSEPGRGTVVDIYFPLAETDRSPGFGKPPHTSTPKRILVFDEDPRILENLTQTLTGAGFHVQAVPSGKDALDVLLNQPVDLLITDLVMPGMDGMELILELRRRRLTLPVVAISGASGAVYLEVARALGAQAALSKPFYPPQLVAKVNELLADAAGGEAPRN